MIRPVVALASGLVLGVFTLLPDDGRTQTTLSPGPSGLQVGYRIEGDGSTSYTARSRNDYVFFTGEPILFKIILGNLGPGPIVFTTAAPEPERLFNITALQAPPLAPNFIGDRPLAANRRRFLDEQEIDLTVNFSTPVKSLAGETFDVRLESETVLDLKEYVEWVMSIPSAALEPGLYRVEVRVNVAQQGRGPLIDYPTVRFEVRARTAEDQPEILRREAMRYFYSGEFERARQAVRELLQVHPNSIAAFTILRMVADAEGNKEEAATHQARAGAIARDRLDHLWLQYGSTGIP